MAASHWCDDCGRRMTGQPGDHCLSLGHVAACQKAQRQIAQRQERANRKHAAVLAVPCTSSVCQNVIGQPCTFAGGYPRQQPHSQRVRAAGQVA